MQIIGKIAFYVLFAYGAIRLFTGLTNVWPLLYGKSPVHAAPQVERRYYSFQPSPQMEQSQLILLVVSGLLLIGLAFFIRKKVDDKTFGKSV